MTTLSLLTFNCEEVNTDTTMHQRYMNQTCYANLSGLEKSVTLLRQTHSRTGRVCSHTHTVYANRQSKGETINGMSLSPPTNPSVMLGTAVSHAPHITWLTVEMNWAMYEWLVKAATVEVSIKLQSLQKSITVLTANPLFLCVLSYYLPKSFKTFETNLFIFVRK